MRLYPSDSLWSALGLTTLSTFLPGLGFVIAGRYRLGLSILVPHLLTVAVLAVYTLSRGREVLTLAVHPDLLLVLSVVLVLLLLLWVTVLAVTYEMLRPERLVRWQRLLGTFWVMVLGVMIAAPLAVGARYAYVQQDLVTTVFADHEKSATRPTVKAEQPWGPDERVNVLLLGGDGGVNRVGIRTDTVILASLDAATGDTVLFSLPRNLANVPFPEGSALDEVYPEGFTGEGDPLEWMLNAVYGNLPQLHPKILGDTDNKGADAVKLAVSGALGIDVNYYALINLRGFREVVDAIGGVTVNINQPIPVGGNTDLGVPPEDYLEPGPHQHLDGFEALWFARGRYGLDDYDRMERQRCVVDALIDEADPVTVLSRYEQLAEAGKKIVRTDIPQDLLPQFVELGLDLQGGEVVSVVLQSSERFDPNDPDYDWVHRLVQRTLEPPERSGDTGAGDPKPKAERKSKGPKGGGVAQSADESCAYDPVA